MRKNALSVKNFKMANMYTVSSVVERLDDFDFDLDDGLDSDFGREGVRSYCTFPGLAWMEQGNGQRRGHGMCAYVCVCVCVCSGGGGGGGGGGSIVEEGQIQVLLLMTVYCVDLCKVFDKELLVVETARCYVA